VEFLEICKVEDLARLAAIMILQSYQDQADSLDMRYNEARIVYITGYNEFELVPPPISSRGRSWLPINDRRSSSNEANPPGAPLPSNCRPQPRWC
jgi:hypothetical protein